MSGGVRKEAEEFEIEAWAFIARVLKKHFTQGEGMVSAKTQEEESQVNFILWERRKENKK